MALVSDTMKVPEQTKIELKSLCENCGQFLGYPDLWLIWTWGLLRRQSPILRMLGVISPFEIDIACRVGKRCRKCLVRFNRQLLLHF